MANLKCILFLAVASVYCPIAIAQPINDICSSAIDLQSFLDAPTELAGPFSNVGATGNDLDIASVTGCWLDDLSGNADGSSPQVDATVWFRFEGYDGVLMLYVQPCDSNLNFLTEDTQLAIYTGECDSLELVICNEDINGAIFNYWSGVTTTIEAGSTYYVAVDGFNYSGFGSPELPLTTGEFCISLYEPVTDVREGRNSKVTAFPNPTSGALTLQGDSPIREIVIFDVAGRCCRSISNATALLQQTIVMPEESGVYTVCVKSDRGVTMHRIVKE